MAITLVASGCSTAGNGASPARTTAPSSPEPSMSASPSSSVTPSPASSDLTPVTDPSTTAAPQQTLATRTFTVTGTYVKSPVRMRFALVELKRRGDLLDLRATLSNLEKVDGPDLRWQVAGRFDGPYRRDITGSDGAFSGAVVTDLAGKKRYLVAADSGKICVCTGQLTSTFIGAGQTVELNATYAAPPASTTKVDVAVTSLGTFRDLAVS